MMKKTGRFALMMLLAVTVLLTGGCGSPAGDTADKQAGTHLRVVLDWYPNAVHSFIYMAKEKGYFLEEGLDVEILFPSGTADAITMTAAGQVDLGIYYPSDIIRARADENIPVKSVGAVNCHPLDAVIAKKEKNILRPRDLSGKKIGYSGESAHKEKLRYIVNADGGDADSMTFVDVGFDLLSALITDQVDATAGNMVNHEVPVLEAKGIDITYFLPHEYGLPNYPEMVFVASDATISAKGDALRGFMRACQRGYDAVQANPSETMDVLMANQEAAEFALDRQVEEKSLQLLSGNMALPDTPFLMQREAEWTDLIRFYKERGVIKRTVPAAEVFTNTLLSQ